MSPVEFKKRLCRPVEFKGHNVGTIPAIQKALISKLLHCKIEARHLYASLTLLCMLYPGG